MDAHVYTVWSVPGLLLLPQPPQPLLPLLSQPLPLPAFPCLLLLLPALLWSHPLPYLAYQPRRSN